MSICEYSLRRDSTRQLAQLPGEGVRLQGQRRRAPRRGAGGAAPVHPGALRKAPAYHQRLPHCCLPTMPPSAAASPASTCWAGRRTSGEDTPGGLGRRPRRNPVARAGRHRALPEGRRPPGSAAPAGCTSTPGQIGRLMLKPMYDARIFDFCRDASSIIACSGQMSQSFLAKRPGEKPCRRAGVLPVYFWSSFIVK